MIAISEQLTVTEAARTARVTGCTVYRWIRDGRLPATKLSTGTFRIATADLAKFLRAETQQTAGAE